MAAEPLRVTQAAKRLGLTTRQVVQLINDRRVPYVMVDGIAHVPEDALGQYRDAASSSPR